ncbi:bifunctional phosphopantothenoylcysteine decarboxylase/phosphopantothenate--cysteine ligase CoaBC [Bacillus sp. RG28]|uniref:Coenzyme A biosynthesis bifunctional protein CoaBC n=1 Tax=Gottfriedia endophytica TaxID=2820819 RepID=A0A940NG72_9BACI|nr:bifunctional phosphopantothenoylcysteine decarboxylase/phosphopantothenate--cysteine ligase CoaBC [Gottfriedia endophytica]MBP0724854.1 bifunctional phosphopantothenoylcysteine decarboxylase/phosphopantothenate--cysteine ligase CoaBC [Gottfriedia endophytica]
MVQKKILLCVTGGIAVYKAAALTSKLVQAGYDVKVMMTQSATEFVAPLTFQALSKNDVYIDTFDEKDSSKIAHIDLGDWPDLIVVAPATANTIGKLANGIGDEMISTTLLAATKPICIAPAMNVNMYNHPIVQKNMATLKEIGYQFIEPDEGYLACGYVGKGRLAEPEEIVSFVNEQFTEEEKILSGKKIVISAGPTREKIDPVRYISNHSSGKMGYSIAEVAVSLGANVVLVSGPTNLTPPSGCEVIQVESAAQMYDAIHSHFNDADVVIKTAAVADYTPEVTYDHKVKKTDGNLSIPLKRTEDILLSLGNKKTHQLLVGFAAETEQVEEYAKGKLQKKNADFIVANNVTLEGAGFGTDTNIVSIYNRNGDIKHLPKMTKKQVAKEILAEVYRKLSEGEK